MSETIRKLAALNQAARAMNSILDPDELLDKILSLLEEVFSLDCCAILLYDSANEELTIHAARGYRPEAIVAIRIAKGEGLRGQVLDSGNPVVINDADSLQDHSQGCGCAMSLMAAPLRINDEIIGVLDAERRRPGAFQESDLDLFRIFANQAATAIYNARLVSKLEGRTRELEKKVNELALLNRLGQQMNSNLSLDSLLGEILFLAQKALHFDHCAVLLREDRDGEEVLVGQAVVGYRDDVQGMYIRTGQGITGLVLKTGEPILVPDVKINGRYIEGVAGGRCEMAAPLVVRNEVIGVLDAEATEPNAFNEEDLRLFSTFASWAAIALHNAEIHEQLERKNLQLDVSMQELNRMNMELREYADRIEVSNQDLEKRVRELMTLQEASRAITSSLDLNDTLRAITEMSREIVQSSTCAIRLLDEESGRMQASENVLAGQGPQPTSLATQREPSGRPRELKSFLGVPLKIGNRVIGYFELGSIDEGAFSDNDRRVLQVLASQAAIAIENARLFESTQQTYYETIRSLAQALEARDSYTQGHSERVTQYSLRTARKLGLDGHSQRIIQYAGLLHDIGKIGISDSVLHKRLKLDDKEWETIRNHPLFGDSILGPLKFLQEAQKIVLRHHEHYDGSGYPGRLKGEEIPLEARVIAVADAYDAMTSDRPYRKAMPHLEAIREIRRVSGQQLDPAVVEAFLSIVDEARVDLTSPNV